jgi:competence protein ComFB
MGISNVMEEIVLSTIHEKLKFYDCCTCEQCINDMLAMALNMLPAMYASSNKGMLITKAINSEPQNRVNIDIAVLKAIDAVASRPHHSVEKMQGT